MKNLNLRLANVQKRIFTMDFDKPNAAGKEIEKKLIEIRESINAPIGKYRSKKSEDDGKIKGEDLANNAAKYPNQPIIIDGEIHMVYIKDNYLYNIDQHNDEISKRENNHCFVSGKKVHFYYCKTLRYMKAEGRLPRYRHMQETQNTYLIDLQKVKNLQTRLQWCKPCIDVLLRNGKISRFGYRIKMKDKIAKYGDAKELMACVEIYNNNSRTGVPEIQNFVKKTMIKK